jgi:hypothetical protein
MSHHIFSYTADQLIDENTVLPFFAPFFRVDAVPKRQVGYARQRSTTTAALSLLRRGGVQGSLRRVYQPWHEKDGIKGRARISHAGRGEAGPRWTVILPLQRMSASLHLSQKP